MRPEPIDLPPELNVTIPVGATGPVPFTTETSESTPFVAVEAAVEAGARRALENGMLVDKNVIANPHEELWNSIL